MFNSSFAREMTDYLELRTAVLSVSSASNDRRVLLLLDQYLVLSGFQGKELTEDILSAWSKTLSGKSKTVKEKLAVVRGFGKYLNTLGHQSFLPTLPVRSVLRASSDLMGFLTGRTSTVPCWQPVVSVCAISLPTRPRRLLTVA